MSDDVVDFVLKELPAGIMVFNRNLDVIAINRAAANFCGRHELPARVLSIVRKMFDAMRASRVRELFSGEVFLTERIPGAQNSWTFKFAMRESPLPTVTIFITEELLADRMDLNKIRREKRLTRRETDILRRMINGMKNGEIAEDLDVTEQTIKDHLSNIYAKFAVKNRFGLLSSLTEASALKRELD
jgi:DNA-binding CsgD family transcriptional regulator